MSIGIIAEFNPFHNGHKYLIDCIKKDYPNEKIVIVMSGNFTQRGDIAINDKYDRGEIAIRNGGDLVVELPIPYSISSAENFAYGAVKILSNIKDITMLAFASECACIKDLEKTAELLYDISLKNEKIYINENAFIELEFNKNLKNNLKKGLSYPKSISEIIKNNENYKNIENVLRKPNNLLGAYYIMAIKKLKLTMKYITYKRIGNDYNDDSITTEYPSATALRSAFFEFNSDYIYKENKNNEQLNLKNNLFLNKNFNNCSIENLKNYMPIESFNICVKNTANNQNIFKILSYAILNNESILCNIQDCNISIKNKIIKGIKISTNYNEFINNIKHKSLTQTRIQRLLLFILFNITKNVYENLLNDELIYNVLAVKKEEVNLLANINGYVIKGYKDIMYKQENKLVNLLIYSNEIYKIATETISKFKMRII